MDPASATDGQVLRRRTVLGGGLAAALTACGRESRDPTGAPTTSSADTAEPTPGSGPETVTYGEDPSQFLELTRPSGTSRGVVVVIHGGFWSADYSLELGRPLARSLVEEGWTAANLEFRRIGNGGGWPATFDDVSAAIDALADVDGLDTSRVVTLGHSSGGHLAVWAAGRQRLDRWQSARVPVSAAISQAGILDLRALRDSLNGGAVIGLMGDAVDTRLAEADPLSRVPLEVPVRCIHGTEDSTVPVSQSRAYVDAATAAGADASLAEVAADHLDLIEPTSPAWRRTLALLRDLPTD